MKTLLLFIFSLFSVILGENLHLHANANLYKLSYSSTANFQQHPNKFKSLKNQHNIVENASINKKNELLSFIEDEDEELIFSKKQLITANHYFIVSYATRFNLRVALRQSLPFNFQLSFPSSCKYILHRILRL